MAYVNTPTELAKTIVGMSYAGLMDVARQLVDMNKPETGCARDLTTDHGMADTLSDWAGAVVDEAEEQERAAKAAKAAASAQ